MTEKKENILNAALKRFAEEGFRSTSTSKVANEAGVSEGLIFRHFKNKEGLLEAIMEEGEQRLQVLFSDIVSESDPQKVINNTFNLVKSIANSPEQSSFWKLQYKLKWEMETYDEEKIRPIEIALTSAFEKFGYMHPKKEAQLILMLLDGMAMRLFLTDDFNANEMVDLLLEKYQES